MMKALHFQTAVKIAIFASAVVALSGVSAEPSAGLHDQDGLFRAPSKQEILSMAEASPDHEKHFSFVAGVVKRSMDTGKEDFCLDLLRSLPRSGRNEAFIEWMIGKILLSQKQYGDSVQSLNMALKMNSEMAGAWSDLGRAHFSRKSGKDAVRCFRRSLSLNPDCAISWAYMGTILRSDPKTKSLGIYAQKTAVGLKPSLHEVFVKSGAWLPPLEKPEDAERWYELYRTYYFTLESPEDPTRWYDHIIMVDYYEGRSVALKRLKHAMHLHPGDADLMDLESRYASEVDGQDASEPVESDLVHNIGPRSMLQK